MDPTAQNPIAALLDPRVLAWLTLQPAVIQWLRKAWNKWHPQRGANTGAAGGILNFASAVILVIWAGISLHMPSATIVLQCALAIVYTNLVYTSVVEPMSESSNPLIPTVK